MEQSENSSTNIPGARNKQEQYYLDKIEKLKVVSDIAYIDLLTLFRQYPNTSAKELYQRAILRDANDPSGPRSC